LHADFRAPSISGQSARVTIHYERDDEHIVLITIDRPEARNSADMDHFKWLREAWERFDADDEAWVAIITGVGDAFFTGADLKTYVPAITALGKRIQTEGITEIDGYRLDDGTRAVLRGAKIWKPIIAAVNGYCTAGGMEMLGGVDIRVACPEAQFAVMEPKRGLFAGGGTTVRLPRQIPFPQAMEFLLCADLVPADRAHEMGLLNRVVPAGQLLDVAYEYARRITANAPLAVQATKQSVWEGLGMSLRDAYRNEAQLSSMIFATEDAREGPAAFAEKRPPRWQGK
jgi:enoyl-CoA hydratase